MLQLSLSRSVCTILSIRRSQSFFDLVILSVCLQNVSELVRESSRIMAGYEVFRERLQSLVAGADAGIFHALDLSQLAHSIRE